MMKKILVCLLVMIMMVFVASAAMAEVVNVDTAVGLKAALENGKSVNLIADIILTEDSSFPDRLNSLITVSGDVTITSADSRIITNSIEDAFVIPVGTSLTLGEKITINSTDSILYVNGGTANVEGAVLKTTASTHNAVYVNNGGTFNVKSGSVIGENDEVTVSVSNATANISGGTVSSTKRHALIAKESANVTISNGKVITTAPATANGVYGAALSKNKATINVTGGTLESQYGAAVVAFTEKSGGSVNVSGGNLIGGAYSVYESNGASLNVTGGTFSDDKFVPYLAAGLVKNDLGNGLFSVGTPVAPSSHSHPKTGDSTPIALLAALLVVSALGMTFMRRKAYR